MKRPKQKPLTELMLQVEEFNRTHELGDIVQVRRSYSQPFFDVTIKHPATILGGHTAVGWFKELSGCHSLDFVRDKPKTK